MPLIATNDLSQSISVSKQENASLKLRGDNLKKEIEQLNYKYSFLEGLIQDRQLVKDSQATDSVIVEEENVATSDDSVNDVSEPSYDSLLAPILDAQSKLVNNKDIVVNVSPEQRTKFEELNACFKRRKLRFDNRPG